ncbi:saccharopine dehydrogenase family protein [Spirillospora sp. CA-294931]|uniref:saccharopine dehydrogenase family protein n=1 Tax=Spirillospora sp. CA-294931 TaxID=3240042 RepID=UPI003D8B017A
MKVLALGGAGAMGAVAVREAAGLAGVTEIVVADRNLAAAERVASRIPGKGAVLRVDVTDAAALRAALADADIVLNTVGPFYRFGVDVLRASIETRTDYLDICDDWEPTLDMLGLDAEARAAGVRAVVGMGASPGLSNLLAARAVNELDSLQDIYTAWQVEAPGAGREEQVLGPDGKPTAAVVHWMQQISGRIAVVEKGEVVHRPPLRPVTLCLPGDRTGTAYTVGHPEPVTLRRSYAPTGDAANLMIITTVTVAYVDALRRDIDAGRLTNEAAAAGLANPSLRRGLGAFFRSTRLKGPGSLPPFFAAATGTHRGEPRTVLAELVGDPDLPTDMAEATGIPLALGLAQFIDGTVNRPGVHPPETAMDADRVFRDLAPHGARLVVR